MIVFTIMNIHLLTIVTVKFSLSNDEHNSRLLLIPYKADAGFHTALFGGGET